MTVVGRNLALDRKCNYKKAPSITAPPFTSAPLLPHTLVNPETLNTPHQVNSVLLVMLEAPLNTFTLTNNSGWMFVFPTCFYL